MKLIIAIIGPEKLPAVEAALPAREACLLSVSHVVANGRESGHTTIYRGTRFRVPQPKLRLEIVAEDWLIDGVVKAVVQAVSNGGHSQNDDYHVCVMPLDDYLTSRTAQEDRWHLEPGVEDPW
jgi:nitrogen regulatory protein P-II 1